MELRHLLYFKTVAEELHFRRAASRLFISQPPLSRQIKELEEELGVVLFLRNNKKVTLTEAGSYFKKETDALFAQLETSKNRVKQIHGAVSGQLRIGYISSVYHEQLLGVLKEIRTVYPFVKTKLYEIPTVKQIKALESGKLDIGIMRAPVLSEKLELKSLFTDPFCVALPEPSGPFDDLEGLKAYLKEQPFVFFNSDYAPEYHHKLIEICQRLGFYPDVMHEANNVHSILRLVENGLGVSIVPRSLKENFKNLKLSFYELDSLPISTEVVLAYQTHSLSPAAEWLINRYSSLFIRPGQ